MTFVRALFWFNHGLLCCSSPTPTPISDRLKAIVTEKLFLASLKQQVSNYVILFLICVLLGVKSMLRKSETRKNRQILFNANMTYE